MSRAKRAISLCLLAAGVILVFAGVNSAVGFSAIGVIASAAAVAALLYSGAVWFGTADRRQPPGRDSIFVFDRTLRVAHGALRGAHLTACFPPPARAALEARCREALAGTGARFSYEAGGERLDFDAVPVRAADGTIVYGLLMSDVRITSAPDSLGV
jgi:hypothetical protein